MMHIRNGGIFVYQTNRTNRISSVDYRTFERQAYVSLRVTNKDRDQHFQHCEEVYRILMANRRAGPCRLNGYEFLEVVDDLSMNDLSGMYATTIDCRLTGYAHPIRSAGFGVDDFGEPIGDRAEPHFRGHDMIMIRLDWALSNRGMKLKTLAELTGIDVNVLSRFNTGKTARVNISMLDSICKALDCQPGELLLYVDEEKLGRR